MGGVRGVRHALNSTSPFAVAIRPVLCARGIFEACIAQLRFPITHRRSIRTTNLLKRLFGEERRGMKIVANAFGERPVLKLMYASLIRASECWRGLRVGAFETK